MNEYRYILSVDGVGCADRFGTLLTGSSAVVKLRSVSKEFWYDDLVPGVHYIDAKDPSAVQYVHATPAMVHHANEYMRQYGTTEARLLVLRKTLEEYKRQMVGPCDEPLLLSTLPSVSEV